MHSNQFKLKLTLCHSGLIWSRWSLELLCPLVHLFLVHWKCKIQIVHIWKHCECAALFHLISFLIIERNVDNLSLETFDIFRVRLMSHWDRQVLIKTNFCGKVTLSLKMTCLNFRIWHENSNFKVCKSLSLFLLMDGMIL